MKTKEELLKIYSAYLPYKLKGKSIYNVSDDSQNETCTLTTKDGFNNLVGIDDWVNQYSYPIKPILYSMEMLTQEIEHNGEKFVPIEYLMKMRSVDINNFCCENRKQKAVDALLNDLKITNRIAIDMFNKLLEWHFNVFGLEESEYIKKETL